MVLVCSYHRLTHGSYDSRSIFLLCDQLTCLIDYMEEHFSSDV